jgi:cyclophilin family peptidyl-prolyl cis-trans isomerase
MEGADKSRGKMSMMDNVSISSPPKGTKKKHKEVGPTSMRLYRAPQSSIRNSDSVVVVSDEYRDKAASNARRRRQQVNTSQKSPSLRSLTSPTLRVPSSHSGRSIRQKNFSRHQQRLNDSDDSSSNSVVEMLGAPCLWMDDVEGNMSTPNLPTWSPPGSKAKSPIGRKLRGRHSLAYGCADSVLSDHRMNGDEESVCTHYTTRSMCEVSTNYAASVAERDDGADKAGRLALYQRRWVRFWHYRKNSVNAMNRRTKLMSCLQVLFVLAFIVVVCDSRRRVHRHNHQLREYDEERAHILEQMTWIDNAAKKVHKKYANYDQNLLLRDTSHLDSKDWKLREENESLQGQLDQLQLRVQQNARDRTVRQFGDKPVQVSLPVSEGDISGEHIVIALSDDAPHAVSTFLQQVSIGLWDEVDFQRFKNGRVIQAASRFTSTTPVLEFVEKSRGCRQAGSVAVHQLESDDFHVLVLKIHMEETASIDEGDVCIGSVLKGLEVMEQIIPQIPIIQSTGSTPLPNEAQDEEYH